jgi:hypothetical protein
VSGREYIKTPEYGALSGFALCSRELSWSHFWLTAHCRFCPFSPCPPTQACPLLVPKHVKRTPGASDVEYFQGLGYKIIDDPKKPDVKRLENADEYVARMTAMVLLYASIVQTESAANPLPLSNGWTWMARCLNSMPPNRWGGVWAIGCAVARQGGGAGAAGG